MEEYFGNSFLNNKKEIKVLYKGFSFLPDLVQVGLRCWSLPEIVFDFSGEPLEVGSAASLGVTIVAITIDLF
ncbi:hypothetical protein HAX54_020611 [Datura stramonium]|uniref:Uncharacterized protein n=1 Tax=Datura stramonium TaxID=4076 RepID=A0ABS8UTM1_DATST|nr:hypothetical protein [Datura stramonium]